MKGHVLVGLVLVSLVVIAAGLSLRADPPKEADPPKGQDTPKDCKPLVRDEHGSYACVELKGRFSAGDLILHVGGGDDYELDLSRLKKWQGEAVRKLDGEILIVTGDLILHRPGRLRRTPQVLVSSVSIR